MSNKVWVLTREINDYNQDGEYFEAVFKEKPTIEDLVMFFKSDNGYWSDPVAALANFTHIIDGGGRIEHEHEWYNLIEVELR